MDRFIQITYMPERDRAMLDAWKCILETKDGEVIVFGSTPNQALERAEFELKYELEALIS